MEQKEKFITAGIIVVLLAGGLIWWTYPSKSPSTDSAYIPPAETTSTQDTSVSTPVTSNNSTIPTAPRAYTTTRVQENGKFVTVVSYNGKAFSPRVIEINRGESVRFVNKSSTSMRIASDTFEDVPIYAGFNQVKSVGKNGTYSLSFTEPGVWSYYNLDGDADIVGVVYVR